MNLSILGAGGRMGAAITRLAAENYSKKVKIVSSLGRTSKPKDLSPKTDVLIDVSLPEPCMVYLKALLDSKKHLPALVIGSTGWATEGKKLVDAYSKKAPVIMTSNFSPAVNLFHKMLEDYASVFKNLGYECSVFESHHNKKKDAPSGTAKFLMAPLEKINLKPQVSVVRAGNIVGTHEVSFIGPQDIFEIRHEALNRDLFAQGAILAALWLQERRSKNSKLSGYFSMTDVLSLVKP